MSKRSHVMGATVVIMALGGLGLGWVASSAIGSIQTGGANAGDESKGALSEARVGQQQVPTATPVSRRFRSEEVSQLPITTVVQAARIIAEVDVETLHPARFNTTHLGTPSVPLSLDPMGEDDEGWLIFRTADLKVVTLYKGTPGLDYLVAEIPGGEVAGHQFFSSGGTRHELEQGDRALVLVLKGAYSQTGTGQIPWISEGLSRADSLTQGGETAEFVALDAAFLYDSSHTTASSWEIEERVLGVSALKSWIQAILSVPSPTPTVAATPTP